MATYQCPKCFNTLLRSNKMLHDLKCTKESPVELSQENPYTSGPNYFGYNDNNYGLRYSSNDYSSLRISDSFNVSSELRNSAGFGYYKRKSWMNDDGTTSEFKKETNMAGKEELLEITYDPQGNIIGRKKADGGSSNVKFKFHELQDYNAYDPMDNYNIYEGGSVYVQTIPTTNIVYEPVEETYSVEYTVPNYALEHDFGSRGYSLMQNNINNVKVVNLDENQTSNNNFISAPQSSNNNQDLEKYFSGYENSNSYNNQNTTYSTDNYTFNNTTNYSNENYNYFQNTSTNNLGNNNNTNYQSNDNNQNMDDILSKCAKVTKLSGTDF